MKIQDVQTYRLSSITYNRKAPVNERFHLIPAGAALFGKRRTMQKMPESSDLSMDQLINKKAEWYI